MNKDIKSYNYKGQKHGHWEVYWDGDLWYKCYYINGRVSGYEEFCDTYYNKLKLNFHL